MIFITFIIVIIFITSRLKKPDKTTQPQPLGLMFKVTKVIDGDTIEIDYNGRTETIRLLGIDSPEIVDTFKPVQCFAKESSDFAKKTLIGKNIFLEVDTSQPDRDKFNRLLRYVFLEDNTNFNLLMIKDGYGREYTYEGKNYKYRIDFETAEKEAKSNLRGLWSCGVAVN